MAFSNPFKPVMNAASSLLRMPSSPAIPKPPTMSPIDQLRAGYNPATPAAPNMSTPRGAVAAPFPSFSLPVVPQVRPTASVSTMMPPPPVTPTTPAQNPAAPAAQKPPAPAVPPPPANAGAPTTPTTPDAPAAPTAPTIPPETQAAVTAAEQALADAARISPEELSTQEDIDKLIESTKKAYRNIEDQPIAMDFITGQMASVEKRALDLAEPLERKLSRLQAARQSSLESSKFALERADKRLSSAESAAATARTEAESARRFGITQAGDAETRALAAKKFDEDKRQFGLQYALDQQKVALDAAKQAAELGQTTGITPETGQALQLVNELIPRTTAISGVFRTGRLTGEKAKLDQLVSTLSLNARKLIKGSGSVSDKETQMLQEAATTLSSGLLSEQATNRELRKIRGVLNSNAGMPVVVKVIDPNTGQGKQGQLMRNDIYDAASQGFIIEYM